MALFVLGVHVFVYQYVTFLVCLLNMSLKGFSRIFIQKYYVIFLHECIDFVFQCIFVYNNHVFTFACISYC